MLKFFKLFLVGLVVLLLTACGGGGGKISTKLTIVGMAQLGYISGGTVSLYDISDLDKPIATTESIISNDLNKVGRFKFDNIDIIDSKYYLLTVTGGYDVDADDNGVIDKNTTQLKGTAHSLIKGEMLKNGVKINALSDIFYEQIEANLQKLSSSEITKLLNDYAKAYLYDLNDDNSIDYTDVMDFDPIKNKDKMKVSYKNILDFYITKIHNNDKKTSKLSSLLYIDKPIIKVENGNLQEVPFKLKATLSNIPQGLKINWYIDNSEKNSINEIIKKDGIYKIIAQLYDGDSLVTTVDTTVVATTRKEIASAKVEAGKSSKIIVDTDSNSTLAGTQIIVPEGAVDHDVNIVVKKASINAIPTDDTAISLTDVLVLEPSGLTFDKPVQVRLPYDENLDLSNKKVRIARYSEGGKVDYIAPLYIDKENHEVVFETEHFTVFEAKTDIIGDSDDEKFINALNQEFPEFKRDIDDWEPILNITIDKETNKVTVYDYLKTYIENKRVFIFISQKGVLKEDGTIDYNHKYNFPYYMALNHVYPDSADYSKTVQMWNDIKVGFDTIDLVNNIGGTVINLAKGEVYRDFIETVLGIPTTSNGLAFYSPTEVGTHIIKTVVNIDNNRWIEQLFNDVYMDSDGKFSYDNELEDLIKEFLEKNNIRWMAEDIVRRYRNFIETKEEQYKHAKQSIQQAIDEVDYKNKLQENEDSKSISFIGKSGFIEYSKEDTSIKIDFEMNTYGYDDGSSIYLKGKLFDIKNNLLKDKISLTCEFSEHTTSMKKVCKGYFFVDVNDIKNNNTIKLKAYKYGAYSDTDLFIHIKEKNPPKIVNVTKLNVKGYLEGDNYIVKVSPVFDIAENPPVDIVGSYDGQSISDEFTISSDQFNNESLRDITFVVKLKEFAKDAYKLEEYRETIDIKSMIDKALKNAETQDDNKNIVIPKLTIDGSDTINEGEYITFKIKKDAIKKIIRESFYGSIENKSKENGYYFYTVKYNKYGKYEPSLNVLMNDGKIETIKADTVYVIKNPEDDKDTHLIPPEVSSVDIKCLSNHSISGKIDVFSSYPTNSLSFIIVKNPQNGKLSKNGLNYTYTPNKDYSGVDTFGYKVKDNTTGLESNEATVSIDVIEEKPQFIEKKSISLISSTSLNDSCRSFYQTGCEATAQKGKSYTKTWTFKNSGNIDLSNVYIKKLSQDSEVNMQIIKDIDSNIKINQTSDVKIKIDIPSNVTSGVHKGRFKLVDKNGDVPYKSTGGASYFWYMINIPIDLPKITLQKVDDGVENNTFTFTATLDKSLDKEYSVKLSLGDNGGGWLEPKDMITNNRIDFILSQNISKAGDRKYRVAIFKDNKQLSSWIEGTYKVYTLSKIPQNLKASQTTEGVLLSWDAVEGAKTYAPLASLDYTENGDYADITSGCDFKTKTSCLIDSHRFDTHKIWYFAVRADNNPMSKPVKFEWNDVVVENKYEKYLKGKTLYQVKDNEIIKWNFDNDLTEVDIYNADEDNVILLKLQNNGLSILDTESNTDYFVIKSVNSDHLILENADITDGGAYLSHTYEVKLYFDEPKKLDDIDLASLIVGKTLYQNCYGSIDQIIFGENNIVTWIESDGDSGTEFYEIKDKTIYTWEDSSEDRNAHLLIEQTDKYVRFSDIDDGKDEYSTFYFIRSDAESAKPDECGNSDSDDYSEKKVSNVVSGNVTFKDSNDNTLTVPSDAWIRITPEKYQVDGNWNGINCKISSSGSFGEECYLEGSESEINEIIDTFQQNNTTYQVVVYKNHIEPNEHHWNRGEDVYRYVGGEESSSSWQNIEIYPQDYQDRSDEKNIDFDNIGSNTSALIYPNGGERWIYGSSEIVKWNTNAITGDTVSLYVLHDNPSDLNQYASDSNNLLQNKNWYNFADNIPNTGSYTVDPKYLNGSGNAYIILIIGSHSGWDISNKTFELINSKSTNSHSLSVTYHGEELYSTSITTKLITIKEQGAGFAHIPYVKAILNNGYVLEFKYCALNGSSDTQLCSNDDWLVKLTDSQNKILYNSSGAFSTGDDPYNGKINGTFSSTQNNDTIYGEFTIENMDITRK